MLFVGVSHSLAKSGTAAKTLTLELGDNKKLRPKIKLSPSKTKFSLTKNRFEKIFVNFFFRFSSSILIKMVSDMISYFIIPHLSKIDKLC